MSSTATCNGWVGIGFQTGMIFPQHVAEFAGGLFRNGMTVGGLVAILMTVFVEMTKPPRSRTEVEFDLAALPRIREFLGVFASGAGWGPAMADRLEAAGEETLLTLLQDDDSAKERFRRRLRVAAYRDDGGAVLEFVAAPGGENLEDRIALLGGHTDEAPIEREVSLRLLRHLASTVHHQQYHDTDIVTVRVETPE